MLNYETLLTVNNMILVFGVSFVFMFVISFFQITETIQEIGAEK